MSIGMPMACSKQLTLLLQLMRFSCAAKSKRFSSSRAGFSLSPDNFPLFCTHNSESWTRRKTLFLKQPVGKSLFMCAVHWVKTLKYFLIVLLGSNVKGFSTFSFQSLAALCNHTRTMMSHSKIFSSRFHNSSVTWGARTSKKFHFRHLSAVDFHPRRTPKSTEFSLLFFRKWTKLNFLPCEPNWSNTNWRLRKTAATLFISRRRRKFCS